MNHNSLRVAIVGAGPAGFYAAGQLFDQQDVTVEIDLFDRLPTPHGLVRAGVAPDHSEKKLVIDNMFDFYLNHPNMRFFGNIALGKDISHDELVSHYHAVIYSVGANSDTKMNISGEALAGSWSAREFVAWYNGHPDYCDLKFDFSCKRAVVVGNGNVALDVARILTLPEHELKKTDIADHAIAALSKSKIAEVVILGRRSHYQAAYNNPELEEFAHLNHVDIVVDGDELTPELASILENTSWENKRKAKTLVKLKASSTGQAKKRIVFKFLSSPSELVGTNKVEQVNITRNTFEGTTLDNLKLITTNEKETIDAGLVFRSIGYRGEALDNLPFDDTKGIIPNKNGRVVQGQDIMAGVYVTGWIKRGPRGVIGSNKKCARDTVYSLLEDYRSGKLKSHTSSTEEVDTFLHQRKPELVTTTHWRYIDRQERSLGREQHRPRVKYSQWQALLDVAGAQAHTSVAGE
jgi:ferredoxin--NADP+ reductase